MRLNEVAARLREIAHELDIDELNTLADEIARRPGNRGPSVSRVCTEDVYANIRAFAARHPHLAQVTIAQEFGVNAGRVSEALNGFRE